MKENSIHIDDFVKNYFTTAIKINGELFTEQKFHNIFGYFERFSKTATIDGNLDDESIKKYYEHFFPDLAPRLKNIKIVFNNALKKEKDFRFIFHPSEQIYSEWINSFLENKPSVDKCKVLLNQYYNWINNSNTTISISEIQLWLEKIGIKLSKTTCQFLLEYGFPYCGYLIKPKNLFQFSGNTRSIIGLLAFNLERLKNGSCEHPLDESAVLALARLEYFHNR